MIRGNKKLTMRSTRLTTIAVQFIFKAKKPHPQAQNAFEILTSIFFISFFEFFLRNYIGFYIIT
jgi:hypothetical protein